jgi:hypothetical protein
LAQLKHITPLSLPSSGFVTITHPFHPFVNQQVEVVNIRRGGADPDLIIRYADKTHAAIAMSSTDYALTVAAGSRLTSGAPAQLLDLHGLCQAAQLIAHLRQQHHSQLNQSAAPKGGGALQ